MLGSESVHHIDGNDPFIYECVNSKLQRSDELKVRCNEMQGVKFDVL